jgi:hypothetical protein
MPKAWFHIKKPNGDEEKIVRVPWSNDGKPIIVPCGKQHHQNLKAQLLPTRTSASKRMLVTALLSASHSNSQRTTALGLVDRASSKVTPNTNSFQK